MAISSFEASETKAVILLSEVKSKLQMTGDRPNKINRKSYVELRKLYN